MSYCDWKEASELDRVYHDTEWGIPVRDDRTQFEYLTLEVMQCGLSWELMLKKREIFRACFDGFDFDKIAAYDETDVERILHTEGMIRSRPKIRAVIGNARCFQEIRKERGSFAAYLWAYTDGKTVLYQGHESGPVPVSNRLSENISADMKKRGFKYIGPVTLYSHLQACGMINDHDANCPCYRRIIENYPVIRKRRYGEKL